MFTIIRKFKNSDSSDSGEEMFTAVYGPFDTREEAEEKAPAETSEYAYIVTELLSDKE